MFVTSHAEVSCVSVVFPFVRSDLPQLQMQSSPALAAIHLGCPGILSEVFTVLPWRVVERSSGPPEVHHPWGPTPSPLQPSGKPVSHHQSVLLLWWLHAWWPPQGACLCLCLTSTDPADAEQGCECALTPHAGWQASAWA